MAVPAIVLDVSRTISHQPIVTVVPAGTAVPLVPTCLVSATTNKIRCLDLHPVSPTSVTYDDDSPGTVSPSISVFPLEERCVAILNPSCTVYPYPP
jgi:hypothetical protein